jgi:hypothetical protein
VFGKPHLDAGKQQKAPNTQTFDWSFAISHTPAKIMIARMTIAPSTP